MDFTDNEKEILKLMFNLINALIDAQDGYLHINNDIVSRSEVYYLEQKLGIE